MKEDLESAKLLTDLSYTQTKIADCSNSIRHPRFDINFSTKYNQELIDAYQSRIIPKRRKQRMLPNIIGKELQEIKFEITENISIYTLLIFKLMTL